MGEPPTGDGVAYQSTIKLDNLTERLVDGAYSGLQDVLERLVSMPEGDRYLLPRGPLIAGL